MRNILSSLISDFETVRRQQPQQSSDTSSGLYLEKQRMSDSPPGLEVRVVMKHFSECITKCHLRCAGSSESGRYGIGPTGELSPSGLVVESRKDTWGHLKWYSVSA